MNEKINFESLNDLTSSILETRSGDTAQGDLKQGSRVNFDPDRVEEGLVKLVLCVVELIRQLIVRQSIRRVESGSISEEEIENLGLALERLEEKMEELKEYFGIDDLNIDLGPLGRLLD